MVFGLFLEAVKDTPGTKIMLGDNLASHFSEKVLKACEEMTLSLLACFRMRRIFFNHWTSVSLGQGMHQFTSWHLPFWRNTRHSICDGYELELPTILFSEVWKTLFPLSSKLCRYNYISAIYRAIT
ncbi:unnamed protein product [Clavelina lepadiformis]|uniref:DDE-1 domain-containing protein n=1 Tax=Clavelina lepadiformis TaxID=159417 RepID=A0ABP0F0U0_CLALP